MQDKEADWTLFWRQLAELRVRIGDHGNIDAAVVAEVMQPAFYINGDRAVSGLLPWLQGQWAPAALSSGADAASASAAMKQASPKYVPREWMLVTAYKAAETGDYAPMRILHELFKTPCAPPLPRAAAVCSDVLLSAQLRRTPRARCALLHSRASGIPRQEGCVHKIMILVGSEAYRPSLPTEK
jgi:uncharacterized protein YdiU (UPF0061 family)